MNTHICMGMMIIRVARTAGRRRTSRSRLKMIVVDMDILWQRKSAMITQIVLMIMRMDMITALIHMRIIVVVITIIMMLRLHINMEKTAITHMILIHMTIAVMRNPLIRTTRTSQECTYTS